MSPSKINDHELQQMLRGASAVDPGPSHPGAAADFAERILAGLPSVRYVIPGSSPGTRMVTVAGLLGLGTALLTGLSTGKNRVSSTSDVSPEPPPAMKLFQAAEPALLPASPPALPAERPQ